SINPAINNSLPSGSRPIPASMGWASRSSICAADNRKCSSPAWQATLKLRPPITTSRSGMLGLRQMRLKRGCDFLHFGHLALADGAQGFEFCEHRAVNPFGIPETAQFGFAQMTHLFTQAHRRLAQALQL